MFVHSPVYALSDQTWALSAVSMESVLAPMLVLNVLSTAGMMGLIWFVQVVHYPLMARIGSENYQAFQREHMRRTTWVVGPLMLTEALTAVGLVLVVSDPAYLSLAWFALGLLAMVWLSTACLQVPAHNRLLTGFDRQAHRVLVRSNWVRTLGWTGRGFCVGALALHFLAGARLTAGS